jgi:hypothetical protein
VRRAGSVKFLDIAHTDQLSVADVVHTFAPLLTEIRPWIGVKYWDATPAEANPYEYVPIATLVVSGVDTTSYPQVTIAGHDRMWMVGPTSAPMFFGRGTLASDAMKRFLGQQIPAARLDTSGIADSEYTLPPSLYAEQDDAVEKLHDLAAVTGQVLYLDPMGAFTTADEPSTLDDPVMRLAPGPLNVMMRPKRTVDASQAINAVVVTGESASGGAPPRGYAQDDDPDSATYVAAVGLRPTFLSLPQVTGVGQAALVAKARLRSLLGIPSTVAVPIMPNPALEAGDVIVVTDPSQNIDYPMIIDSFPVDFRAAEQELTCRPRVIR